jgi:hypothetical protein
MSNIQVQLRKGTTAQHNSFTGAQGELTVDTDKNALVLHDGATQGGIQIAKESAVNVKDYGAKGDGSTDDTNAIQAALNDNDSIYIPEGTYLVSGLEIERNNMRITGEGYFSILKGTSSYILRLDNQNVSSSENLKIAGINFQASSTNTTTAITGKYSEVVTYTAGTFQVGVNYTIESVGTTDFTLIGAANNNVGTTFTATGAGTGTGTATDGITVTNYIYMLGVFRCLFSSDLQYGVKNNLLQAKFYDCLFGRYGGGSMTTAIYIDGRFGVDANANTIDSCYIANISGIGVYIGCGEGNAIINSVIEICGAECVHIEGGLTNNIISCYMERAWEGNTPDGTQAMIKTSTHPNGKPVNCVNLTGSMFNSGSGLSDNSTNKGYFINNAGNVNVKIDGCGWGQLGAFQLRLSPNNSKITFSPNNFYPGNFDSFDGPTLLPNFHHTQVKPFNEVSNDAISGGTAAIKKIAYTGTDVDLAGGASLFGLDCNKPAGASYFFSRCRTDVDGTPVNVHSIDGRGFNNNVFGVSGGAKTTTERNAMTYLTDGTMVFDTTLGKPVWKYGGTAVAPLFVDSTGASV